MNQPEGPQPTAIEPAATFEHEGSWYLPGKTRIVAGRVYRTWERFEDSGTHLYLFGTVLLPLTASQANVVSALFGGR